MFNFFIGLLDMKRNCCVYPKHLALPQPRSMMLLIDKCFPSYLTQIILINSNYNIILNIIKNL